MDAAYKQHSKQARRKNRSSTNLNHLSLAPLTSKFPITDPEDLPEFSGSALQHNVSYLQGKSAPTTPGLLSRSPATTRANSPHRPSSTAGTSAALPKSKSASHLHQGQRRRDGDRTPSTTSRGRHHRRSGSGHFSPTNRRRRDDNQQLSARDRNDSDWMLRTGALISTETREYKGQSWLVSRASSTSLTGLRDAEEEAYERELARERELASRRGSRRGSLSGLALEVDDAFRPLGSRPGSHPGSRFGSRPHSRVGSRSQLWTPMRTPLERHNEEGGIGGGQEGDGSYFPGDLAAEEYLPGPDFVNLDEKLEAAEIDTSLEDEATVRRLVKRDSSGNGHWMGNLIGWSLFAVEENDEEGSSDEEDYEEDYEDDALSDDEAHMNRRSSTRQFAGVSGLPGERPIPAPEANEGGWQDAAWLLSLASKVIL